MTERESKKCLELICKTFNITVKVIKTVVNETHWNFSDKKHHVWKDTPKTSLSISLYWHDAEEDVTRTCVYFDCGDRFHDGSIRPGGFSDRSSYKDMIRRLKGKTLLAEKIDDKTLKSRFFNYRSAQIPAQFDSVEELKLKLQIANMKG